MRFELTEPFGSPVFKTGAISLSATDPMTIQVQRFLAQYSANFRPFHPIMYEIIGAALTHLPFFDTRPATKCGECTWINRPDDNAHDPHGVAKIDWR